MPRVPVPDGPQFQPGGNAPQGRLVAPEASDIGQRQVMALGGAMQEFGASVGGIAQDMQAQADEIRITDALNQVKERALALQYDKDGGFLSVKGRDTYDRPDGQSLTAAYGAQLDNTISDLAGTLGNDRQRAAFAKAAGSVATGFRGQIMAHEAKEYLGYQLSVSEGVISTAKREIGLAGSNFDAVDAATSRIRGEVYRQAKLSGKSAEWQEAAALQATSDAHKLAVANMLDQGDTETANAYINRFGKQMDAGDLLSARAKVREAGAIQLGSARASEALSFGIRASQQARVNATFEQAVEHVFKTEGGFVADDAGRGPSNFGINAGANPDVDVKGLTKGQAAEIYKNRYWDAIGADDLPADLRLVAFDAAVNQGAGRAKQWIKESGGDPQKLIDLRRAHYASLIDKDPARFGQYAKGWEARLRSIEGMLDGSANPLAGTGSAAAPGGIDVLAASRRLDSDPVLQANPKAMAAARAQFDRNLRLYEEGIKQSNEAAVATAMRGMIENGGSFEKLPASVRAAVPPKELGWLLEFGRKVAKGDDRTSPLLYQRLSTDPTYLNGLSDDQFYALRRELSEADFRHFANERGKARGAGAGQKPDDLNTGAINAGLNDRLRQLKIDPTPKDGSDEAVRVGTIRKYFNDYFIAAQREAGKKFSDAEVSQHMDALFAKQVTSQSWWTGKESSQPMFGIKVGDIPRDDRKQIEAAIKRTGVTSPTDAQVLETYYRLRSTSRPAGAK